MTLRHENLTPFNYNTEALEHRLAATCNGYLPIWHRLMWRRGVHYLRWSRPRIPQRGVWRRQRLAVHADIVLKTSAGISACGYTLFIDLNLMAANAGGTSFTPGQQPLDSPGIIVEHIAVRWHGVFHPHDKLHIG